MPANPLTPQDQAALVESIRKGSSGAETELVHLFRRRVYVMLLARLQDRETVYELTQDVLMAVLQALRKGSVRQPERLAAFVYGTARNLLNNYNRAQRKLPTQVSLQPETASADPLDDYDTAERVGLVRQALERLDVYSGPRLPPIPVESCHPFRLKVATHSGESCHLSEVGF